MRSSFKLNIIARTLNEAIEHKKVIKINNI